MSGLLRRAVPVMLAAAMALPALAQDIAPYQPLTQRQTCGTGQMLDAPGGAAVAPLPAPGTRITITDLTHGPDGVLYYQLDQAGYVATRNAPHFCGFTDRAGRGAPHLSATPNSCHLIAASRQTLDQVNAFAADYAIFQPTMAVYRSQNGWYGISVGQVSLAAAAPILANAKILPKDAYCSDGAGYVAVMDQINGRFAEPDDGDGRRHACLTGDGAACAKYADTIGTADDMSEAELAEILRFALIGCMAGNVTSCHTASRVPARIADHVRLTLWPDGADTAPPQSLELHRIGCDAGLLESCRALADSELQAISGDPARYMTALQSAAAGCEASQDQYLCRDMLRILAKRDRAMGQPASADDLFFFAALRADSCKVPTQDTNESCPDVTQTYAALLDHPRITPEQAGATLDYLRSRCGGGDPDACAIASTQADWLDQAERDRAAAQAIAACRGTSGNPTCDRLDGELGAALPQTQRLQQIEFDKLAHDCKAANTAEAAGACASALSYFARVISVTQTAPLEAALQAACTTEVQTGCETLAFVYGHSTLTGEKLEFHGTDQPEKRLAALRMGCRPGELGLRNCNMLGEVLQDAGDQTGAQASFRTACNTVRSAVHTDRLLTDGSCFNAGLHALNRLNDRAVARADFHDVCDNIQNENSPYACKHLALMAMADDAPGTDPSVLLDLLDRACYPHGDFRGDGEGCLYMGRFLLDHHGQLVPQPYDGDPTPDTDEARRIAMARAASHAFSKGCLSKWQPSCAANERLIRDWIAGAYPVQMATCQIRGADGQLRSEKPCRMIRYHVPQITDDEARYIHDETVYIWPDGDQTLVRDGDPQALLNGRPADIYPSQGGDGRCQRNPESGNEFCALFDGAWPGDEEG